MKSLIVDDDYSSRQILVKILEQFGTTEFAIDGPGAVDTFRLALGSGRRFDLVMLDLVLPLKTGHEVLRDIRQMESDENVPPNKRAKVIVTTSNKSSKHKLLAIKYGADKFMNKPVKKDELISLLKSMKLLSSKAA